MKNQVRTAAVAIPRRHDERGSAIILILVFVALFGALSFALTRGGSTGASTITDQQAKLAASEIIEYTNRISTAVKTLLINGCANTQISFQSSETGLTYKNNNAPADYSCHVFAPQGGGLNYVEIQEKYQTSVTTPSWQISGSSAVQDVGTAGTDLYISGLNLNKSICLKINELLEVPNPGEDAPVDSSTSNVFVGAYTASGGDNILGNEDANLAGKMSFCRKGATEYYFHRVLIAR